MAAIKTVYKRRIRALKGGKVARGKLKDWTSEENLIKLTAWARNGLNDEQIANNIGISRQTLYKWRKKDERLETALKKGKEVTDYEVENALFKKAIGGYYEETKERIETIDGKEVKITETTKKYYPPDTTACIFWLKNRKPDDWKDRKAQEVEVKKDGNLEKYFELLDQTILVDN